jgi:hypothetical protein
MKKKPKPVTIPFVGDEEIRDWLDEEAMRQHGRSRSSLMREIVEFYRKYHGLEIVLQEAKDKLETNGC